MTYTLTSSTNPQIERPYLELFELAGDLSHRLNHTEAAIDMYRKGGAYARAIELARKVSPEEVTVLEEEWGDW